MDKFAQKFVEEATDLINNLEEVSLELENNSSDKNIIERIFRIMHTIKGSSGMFGFTKIEEYTHEFENIYDKVRNGELMVTGSILEMTFLSIDHLKNLLKNHKKYNKTLINKHNELLKEIKSIINEGNNEDKLEKAVPDSENVALATGNFKTYYIYFEPVEEILKNGSNPLYILEELNALGNAKIFIRDLNIPAIDKIDPTKCYTAWEVFLATNQGINSIIDVFMFVEEESKLQIKKISEINLLNQPAFIGILDGTVVNEKKIDLTHFLELVHELEYIFRESQDEELASIEKEETDKKVTSIRVSSEKLDDLMNLVSELVTTQARLKMISDLNDIPELQSATEEINKLARQLRDNAFNLSLLPIETMLTRFQRLVRDLSKELGKEVIFETYGTETELDKTIIQNLIDSILHILRNCIDHGIEDNETRLKRGKPQQGKIILQSFYSGAYVVIQIKDDGNGIDSERVYQSAINKKLIEKNDSLSKKEKLNLIFLPGFSTAENVSDVSGRGVGMDVVRKKINELHGDVDIESEIGKGTTVTLKIPLTLSIIDGLLVKICDEKYLIPLSVVDKIYAVEHSKLTNIFNNMIVLDDEQIPFYYLRNEFDLEKQVENKTEQVITVNYNNVKIGLAFDEVIGEYQAVLKPLGKQFKDQEIFSGATILGDGTVALVLDTHKIIKTFSKQTVKTVNNEQ
ncbi:MAG: chemotaxis protein CheA [Chlorobi bacterium]|nr:chemotaxis protein CheA [Chlorobiota bacterium]